MRFKIPVLPRFPLTSKRVSFTRTRQLPKLSYRCKLYNLTAQPHEPSLSGWAGADSKRETLRRLPPVPSATKQLDADVL
jgi:hypothetical protein